MANIVGTVISVNEFYSKEATRFNVIVGQSPEREFVLSADRVYEIPRYQRELRWKENHLMQLISDVSDGSKFLGNIILDSKTNDVFEVIDGQQRMTMIYLVVQYLKRKYGNRIELFDCCPFTIATFNKLDFLIGKNFENLSDEEKEMIDESDELCQLDNYEKMWKFICSLSTFNDRISADKFIKKLKECKINIIINGEGNTGINYFLDVNTKGVQLDKEDIFKGYLFMQDSSDEVKSLWSDIKKQYYRFSKRCNKEYELMKVIEQYFYCELYKNDEFTNVVFNEEFKIVKGGLANDHLIAVICDNEFMKRALKDIKKFLMFANSIVCNDGVSDEFKGFYNHSVGLDDVNFKVYHNILKKLLFDSDIIPKALVLKYFLDCINDAENKTKNEYELLFTIYTLAFLFTIFETKKGNSKIYNIVKQSDWQSQCMAEIEEYFYSADITEKKLKAQYKALSNTENENYEYRAKTLATIFNFLKVNNGKVEVKEGQYDNLKEFITNSNKYSVEHFIVNKSGRIKTNLATGKQATCKYPTNISKYKGSLFNFIFISQRLNSTMENCSLKKKLELLSDDESSIECKYSKQFLQTTESLFGSFPDIEACQTKQEAQDKIDAYFNQDFLDNYIRLMQNMFTTFMSSFYS